METALKLEVFPMCPIQWLELIAMMESNHYEVFNIGNPYEMTVKELAETII